MDALWPRVDQPGVTDLMTELVEEAVLEEAVLEEAVLEQAVPCWRRPSP